jgi:hypothetical protein
VTHLVLTVVVAAIVCASTYGLMLALRDDDADRLASLPDPSPERDLLTRTTP